MVETETAARHDSRRWRSRCTQLCRGASLNFDQHEEDMFKSSLTDRLCKCQIVVCCSLVVILLITLCEVPAEAQRKDRPFEWQLDDPRSLYYGLHLFHLVLAISMGMFIIIGRCVCHLHLVDWELLVTVHGVLLLCSIHLLSGWYVAALCNANPTDISQGNHAAAEQAFCLESSLVLWALAMFASVRFCRFWLLPSACLLSYVSFRLLLGSPAPDDAMVLFPEMVLLCIFACYGVWRNEKHDREKWQAQREVKIQASDIKTHIAVKQCLTMFAGAGGNDVLVELNSDFTVRSAGVVANSFFGCHLDNSVFTDLVHECDRGRFKSILERASETRTPESSPLQLLRGSDIRPFYAQVMVMAIEHRAGEMFYMLGVREETDNNLEIQDGQDNQDMQPEAIVAQPLVKRDMDLASQSARSEQSVALTEAIYWDIQNAIKGSKLKSPEGIHASEVDDVAEARLSEMAMVGLAEHWLLSSKQVKIDFSKELGSGGYGAVYTADFLGTKAAAKIPKDLDGTSMLSCLPSFTNELRVLRRVRHPNIALFFGTVILPEKCLLMLVTELIFGSTLLQFVGRCHDFSVRWKLALGVCQALRYMHGLTPMIIHGDLKGSNVMVEHQTQRAKLLDFGLARMQAKSKRVAPAGGTLAWTAPEVLVAIASGGNTGIPVSASADIFSYGRVLFLVSTGRKPLARFSNEALKRMIRTEVELPDVEWKGDEPLGAKELVECCCRKDPDARIGLVNVQQHLLSFVADDPINNGIKPRHIVTM
eukprot:TRINITY_DN11118_c1_g1_i7.p1 TRINITY_DN11118_c1_g1~~TRINITY_DN11118_c1_g1_i7.p1  ORF type:complete len:779 (-),score=103.48 TRINITY_DN11118_c1_g1_i7:226-2514(-)